MSAVEEYRTARLWGSNMAEEQLCAADAAIAELEVIVANLDAARAETFGQFQHMAKVALEQQRRAEKAEAELE